MDQRTIEMKAEHFAKYEQAAQRCGVDAIKGMVPFSEAQIRKALDAGDLHLNTLDMYRWDRAAGGLDYIPQQMRGMFEGRKGSALSERVCLLKHIARHHIAGQPAPGVDSIDWDKLSEIGAELVRFQAVRFPQINALGRALALAVEAKSLELVPGFEHIYPAIREMELRASGQLGGREMIKKLEYLRAIN